MLLRVWFQNAQGAAFKDRSMNSKYLFRFLQAITMALLVNHSAKAIEIVVPDQYKYQVEAIKEAERAEREQELQGANKSADSGLTIDAPEGQTEGNQSPEVAADEFLVQSVIEATDAATEFEVNLAAGEGIISGQIIDKESGQPLGGVAILLEGTNIATVTDREGRYSLGPAPAGEYTVSFVKTGYIEANVTDYAIVGGEVSVFPFGLPPRPAEMSDEVYELQDFTVTAEVANEMMALIDLKQTAVGAVDFLSAEDMARFGGSDLSDLVQKITGVNVVEGKFAVVRGLSDRYNSTLVNGLPVPSPDPLRQGVQLDLFPTSIIDNIVTNKMFLANFPGNSAGGTFELSTRTFPQEFFAKLKIGTRYNDNLDGFLHSPYAGSGDLNPFSDVERPNNLFPSATSPSDSQVTDNVINIAGIDDDPLAQYSFSFSVGDKFQMNDILSLSLVGSVTSDSKASNKSGGTFANHYVTTNPVASRRVIFVPGGSPPFKFVGNYPIGSEPGGDPDLSSEYTPGSLYNSANGDTFKGIEYDYQQSEDSSLFGYLVGAQFGLGKDEEHKISLVRLYSLSRTDRVTRFSNGYARIDNNTNPFSLVDDPSTDGSLFRENQRARLQEFRDSGTVLPSEIVAGRDIIEFEERELASNQIFGEHDLENALGTRTKLLWGLSESKVTSETPLRSDFEYFQALVDTGDAGRNIPAGSYFIDSGNAQGRPAFVQQSNQEIEHESSARRLDLEHAFEAPWIDGDVVLSGGYYTEDLDREVTGRNGEIIGQLDATDQLGNSPEQLSENLGALEPKGSDPLNSSDDRFVINGDLYDSGASVSRRVDSRYLQLSAPIFEKLKGTLGFRFVDFEQSAEGNAELSGTDGQDGFSLPDLLGGVYPTVDGPLTNATILGYDTIPTGNVQGKLERSVVLPSLVIQFDVTEELSIRAGYSKTEAYPSFREFSPYFDYESSAGEIILGNPNLMQSEVESFDLRFDYDLGQGRYFSFSVFTKEIQNSIEKLKLLGGFRYQFTSYVNNENVGNLRGVEIEARTDLGFIDDYFEWEDALSNLTVGFNATYIDSSIDRPKNIQSTYASALPLNDGTGGVYTISPFNDENGHLDLPGARGLYDQPEWILNADISYELPSDTILSLYLYGQSDVLTAVGSGRAENGGLSSLDEYTASYFELGLNIKQKIGEHFEVGFRVGNLTDSVRRVIYDPGIVDEERYSYRKGRSFSLSGSYSF